MCDPELCLITNIGMDHQQWLGTTRASIANEKAGIIKSGVPVVVVEQHEETREVFLNTAKEKGAPLFWAGHYDLKTDLQGAYQVANLNGAYEALHLLFPDEVKLWKLGFERVVQNTGFFGRWSVIKHDPLTVCDTGHNEHAFNTLVPQALSSCSGNVHWVLGSASDKDHDAFFKTLPKERSIYYWTGCSSPRCATGDHLAQKAAIAGLEGLSFMKVSEALIAAQQNATSNDLIFIGGSTFVIADLEL
jgi:dihydrofolate synthase/folylpolyglutamate synthase